MTKAYILRNTFKDTSKMMGINDELTLLAVEQSSFSPKLGEKLPAQTSTCWAEKIPAGTYDYIWMDGRNGRRVHVVDMTEITLDRESTVAEAAAAACPKFEVMLDRAMLGAGEYASFPTGSQFPLACAGKIAMRTWHMSGTSWVALPATQEVWGVSHPTWGCWFGYASRIQAAKAAMKMNRRGISGLIIFKAN